jgi:hypothetical protein
MFNRDAKIKLPAVKCEIDKAKIGNRDKLSKRKMKENAEKRRKYNSALAI